MIFTSVYGSSVHLLPGLTFLLDLALMFLLLCVHLVVTYYMTRSTSQLKTTTSASALYGSVETTAVYSATPAADVPAGDERIAHKTVKD